MVKPRLAAFVGCLLLASSPVNALPARTRASLDHLFAAFSGPGRPAAVAVAVQDGRVVYSHATGAADIGHAVPARLDTVFEIGSVSKVFTAFAVQRLIRDGRIDDQADIRTYLPGLPDFGAQVRVRDLLRHTSGIRDYFTLAAIRGGRLDDSFSQQDVLALLGHQRSLNFVPGTDRSYSNTNYVLLAAIVEHVTGMPFADYLQTTLLHPAGMTHALLLSDRSRIIPNKAESYIDTGSQIITFAVNSDVLGPSGMWLSGGDYVAWLRYLETAPEASSILTAISQPSLLPDGRTVAGAVQRDDYRGLQELSHDGGDGGYRSVFVYYPTLRLGVTIMTNAPIGDLGQMAERIADPLIDASAHPAPPPAANAAQPPAAAAPAPAGAEPNGDISDVAGRYYSDELDTTYVLRVAQGHLFADHIRNPSVELRPAGHDRWGGNIWYFQTLEVVRNQGRATGFRLSGLRVRNLLFRRLD